MDFLSAYAETAIFSWLGTLVLSVLGLSDSGWDLTLLASLAFTIPRSLICRLQSP